MDLRSVGKDKDRQKIVESLRIRVPERRWLTIWRHRDRWACRKQWLLHTTFLTGEKKRRKVLCTCVHSETLVRVQGTETRLAQVWWYMAVTVASEVQRPLDSHVISFNLEEGERDVENAPLRPMRELECTVRPRWGTDPRSRWPVHGWDDWGRRQNNASRFLLLGAVS